VPAQSTNHFQHKSLFFFSCFLFSHSQLTNKMTCSQSDIVLPMNQSTRFWHKFFFYASLKDESITGVITVKILNLTCLQNLIAIVLWAQLKKGSLGLSLEKNLLFIGTLKKNNPHLLNTSKKRSSSSDYLKK
jgi:hypothetical protein